MSSSCQSPVSVQHEGTGSESSEADGEDVGPVSKLAFKPEEEQTITVMLTFEDKGATEENRYSRKFQLVHLSLFFVISHEAQRKKHVQLADYGFQYSNLMRVYNFRNKDIYKTMMERGFKPMAYIATEKMHLVNYCHNNNDTPEKKQILRAYRFCHAFEEYLNNPVFKPYAMEYAALSFHINVRDGKETSQSAEIEKSGIRQLNGELFGWMFEYFSARIDHYLDKRVPGKQYANEKKFFLARKEYYMSLELSSTKTALVAYCYHIFAIYIEEYGAKEASLMILAFTDLRKLKVKLQGNARELNESAAKTLQDAEYSTLAKILRLDQWEAYY